MRPLLFAMLALLATPLLAQGFKHGDLLPRNDILTYAVSDRPQAVYRLFGKNAKGEWRIKAWPYEKLEEESKREGGDSEKVRQARAMMDYFYGALDNTARLEMGFLDVTLGGAKYVLVLHGAAGYSYNAKPDFLKELLKEELKIREQPVQVYEIKAEADEEGEDKSDPKRARPAFEIPGFDRFYVAQIQGGLVVTNFESSMHDVIERYTTKDYSESLSSREEFAKWRDARSPHDLSLFIVGREIQKAVERMLPDKKQTGGRDLDGAYTEADRWMQLREYHSITIDFDYDDARRGFAIDAKLTTRRKTRLLEQLAIAPSEFKLMKYLPGDAMLSMGAQLGDPAKTWERWVEFARDGERIAKMTMKETEEGATPREDMPPKEKSVDLGKILQGMQEGESHPAPGSFDENLRVLDEQLAKMGTSVKEILAALGSEIIGHVTAAPERTLAMGGRGMDDMFEYSHMGAIVAIKDAKSARDILTKIRTGGDPAKDTFKTSTYSSFELHINADQSWGYCLTSDAVLISFTRPGVQDAASHIESGLKRMLDAAKSTGVEDRKFLSPSSKFVRFDIGRGLAAHMELRKALSEKLDRYAEPLMDMDLEDAFRDTTLALRTVEDPMSVEVGLRAYGMPDFIGLFDSFFSGSRGESSRDAWRYSQDSLRELGRELGSHCISSRGDITLEGVVKDRKLRQGHLQTPFDSRWKGGYRKLGWTSLSQMRPNKEGKLPEWVDQEAVALVEANEKEGFVSYTLAQGDIRSWVNSGKEGFIVLYQTSAETLGGHLVLYADGQVGWLHASVMKDALALNAKGEPVPGIDPWASKMPSKDPPPKRPSTGDPDDPWAPGK